MEEGWRKKDTEKHGGRGKSFGRKRVKKRMAYKYGALFLELGRSTETHCQQF